jgi:plasmid stabilization system protein ParE
MKARLLPSAKRELSNAVNFCEVARPGLGIEFIGEFKKAVETIFENTRIGPVVVETRSGVLQEFILSRFPYRLIYSIETDAILIIAVAHQHRQPLFKYDRTERPLAPARRVGDDIEEPAALIGVRHLFPPFSRNRRKCKFIRSFSWRHTPYPHVWS